MVSEWRIEGSASRSEMRFVGASRRDHDRVSRETINTNAADGGGGGVVHNLVPGTSRKGAARKPRRPRLLPTHVAAKDAYMGGRLELLNQGVFRIFEMVRNPRDEFVNHV